MVDDIKTADPSNALVKFADDLALGVPGNESGDTSRSEAACLQDWAEENRMPLNLEKTYEMVVRRHTSVVLSELIPSLIKRKTWLKLLGVTLQDNPCNWDLHFEEMLKKASGRIYIMRVCKYYGLSIKQLDLLFDSLIMSIFTFAIELWGCAYDGKYLNQIDKFIKRAHKNGYISKRTHIKEIRDKRDKKLWNKITSTEDNALLELLPEKKSRWINGSDFLKSDKSEWPIDDIPGPPSPTAQREMKKKVEQRWLCQSFLNSSNWLKLVRVTAWVLRFCHNLRKKDWRNAEVLSVEELEEAELYWIKSAQQDRFRVEIESLWKGRSAAQANRIADLNPQLLNGILRVGGRIDKAELPWEAKHPIILDDNQTSDVVPVIHYHRKLIHAGVEHVFNHIREKYWILRGRSEVKNCTVKCPLCHRRRIQPLTQRMSSLPSTRLASVSVPFQNVGLDYAALFSVRIGRNRIEKRYIYLFTCMHMRAVHLEVAHSLEGNLFIMALRRFLARRGNPARILSDNGTNFVGAERRVAAPIASADGLVRLAEIVTKAGTYVRPVGKLALLEAHHEE
ncbi:PREDICTED: uncharacterized protein LOC107329134, partial [Paramuricea clavata]